MALGSGAAAARSLFLKSKKRMAVFLDKDGTLIDDIPYNVTPGLVSLALGSAYALSRLSHLRGPLVVVSNQPGVARGYFSEKALGPVQRQLAALFDECGATLSGFYYCPHHPDGNVPSYSIECECRKPAPGLLYRAARELDIDLSRSWMVGDILDDVAAGKQAGCRTILINNGNETEWRMDKYTRRPDYIVPTMFEAADTIMSAAPISHAFFARN